MKRTAKKPTKKRVVKQFDRTDTLNTMIQIVSETYDKTDKMLEEISSFCSTKSNDVQS